MADVLTVVAKIRAAKGKGDALAALLKEQVAAVMKAEPGCLVYRPHRSTKDPDVFIFYEQYKDDAAFDAHRKAPASRGLSGAPGEGGAHRGPGRGRDLSLGHRLACALHMSCAGRPRWPAAGRQGWPTALLYRRALSRALPACGRDGETRVQAGAGTIRAVLQ